MSNFSDSNSKQSVKSLVYVALLCGLFYTAIYFLSHLFEYVSILLFVTTLWGKGDFLLSWVGFSEGRELLPWCCQVELAVLLGKLNRLLNNSLQLVVITNLGIEI